jgi:hypothetical protein
LDLINNKYFKWNKNIKFWFYILTCVKIWYNITNGSNIVIKM